MKLDSKNFDENGYEVSGHMRMVMDFVGSDFG